VLACLPHSGVTRSLIDVLRDSWRPGQLFLDHTTGDPVDAEELGAWFAAREVGYGDATVVGSSAEVAAANAVILMGGTLAVVESARPVLRCYARQVHAVGPVGAGATLKLVVNLVLGLHRAVLAEGLSLAADCGFSRPTCWRSWPTARPTRGSWNSKGPRMVSGDFAPVARLASIAKTWR